METGMEIRAIDPVFIRSGSVLVVDWTTKGRKDRKVDIKKTEKAYPYQQTFSDKESLTAYLDEPCATPTAMRCVHAVNAPWAADCFEEIGPVDSSHDTFVNWTATNARNMAPNRTYIVAEKVQIGHDGIPEDTVAVRTFIDYLTVHPNTVRSRKARTCASDRHAFEFTVQEEYERAKHIACPRRIAMHCQKGRKVYNEEIDDTNNSGFSVNQKDPKYLMVVMESLSHHKTGVDLQREGIFPVDSIIGTSFDHIGNQAMRHYIHEFCRVLTSEWEHLLRVAIPHFRALEDEIYKQPDDDSRASELWAASKNWLDMERLLQAHIRGVQDTRDAIQDLLEDPSESASSSHDEADPEYHYFLSIDGWEESISQKFVRVLDRCLISIQADLIRPTTNLLDMMYKSVAIRDTRLSLDLNASLWRLSWITFIFLPLTFLSGFFGMNVDLFKDNPAIKWYFISGAGIFVVFFLIWLGFRMSRKYRRRNNFMTASYSKV